MEGKGKGRAIKPPRFHGGSSVAPEELVQLSTSVRRDTDAMIGKLTDYFGGNRRATIERAVREMYRKEGLPDITDDDIERYSTRPARG